MIVLKCKMCGADLDPQENSTVCECDYCGTKQTIPAVDDEKKLKLYDRANRLRMNAEFDKAAGVYESIIADFDSEAEAYWGMLLCKYGIEYVDDPATGNKIPTCHRSSYESIMDDADFELVMENAADTLSRTVYREQAKEIEEIRKGIIEVSGKEEPYDIFICYKETAEDGGRTIDSVLAQDVYDALTTKGYRVFFSRITLEDKLGTEYEPYIFAALTSAKVMLAFGTSYDYYNAVWVKNEWSRFLKLMAKDKEKHLIPCYKDIDAYDMPKEFAKLQAQDLGKIGAVQDLVRGIDKLIGKTASIGVAEVSYNAISAPLIKRMHMFLEEGKWKSADEYAEKVLDLDPENGEAYLGKFLAEQKIHKISEIEKALVASFDAGTGIIIVHVIGTNKDKVIKIIQDATGMGLDETMELVARKSFVFTTAHATTVHKDLKEAEAFADLKVLAGWNFDDICKKSANYGKLMKYASSQLITEVNQQLDGAREKIWQKERERVESKEKARVENKAQLYAERKGKKQKKAALRQEIRENEAVLKSLHPDTDLSGEKKNEYEKRVLAAEEAENEYQNAYRSFSSSDSDMVINRYKVVVAEKQNRLSTLGFFKGKEKKQLQAEIEELNRSIENMEESDRKNRAKLDLLKKQVVNKREYAETYLQDSLRKSYEEKRTELEEKIAGLITELDKLGEDFYEFGTGPDGFPIDWIKLTSNEEKTLLLSKFVLEGRPYHEREENVVWENSSLRSYLNQEFIKNYFSVDEQKKILISRIQNSDKSESGSEVGEDTEDKMFVLSIEEVNSYFSSDEDRIAISEKLEKPMDWWLRSSDKNCGHYTIVTGFGFIFKDLKYVHSLYGIRPAFWIKNSDLESLIF